jgi:hypothetical protein
MTSTSATTAFGASVLVEPADRDQAEHAGGARQREADADLPGGQAEGAGEEQRRAGEEHAGADGVDQ